METWPIIRIDIEGVRKSLVHYLGSALSAESTYIQQEITRQLEAIDMHTIIREVVRTNTRSMVEAAVRTALQDAVWKSSQEIETVVVKNLGKK